MFLLIAVLALVTWAFVATIVELRRDGYRRQPTDWTQVPGPDPLDTAHPGRVYR
ncbi:hypothetical protein [Microbacterium sp. CR_7]|uniref:hypothetical protein n=1 Tax=Microbacterium sp. CR_7 TaxID=3055792 RepID=UPI0035BF2B09